MSKYLTQFAGVSGKSKLNYVPPKGTHDARSRVQEFAENSFGVWCMEGKAQPHRPSGYIPFCVMSFRAAMTTGLSAA